MREVAITAEVVTLHVPFRLEERGGRKQMILPAGTSATRPTPDSTLVKALARAFRWKRMLESGEFASIGELAAQEKIAPTYMTRVMRLTLLAPDLVERLLSGDRDLGISLANLLAAIPSEWESQKACLETH